jgi:hypothetical protein
MGVAPPSRSKTGFQVIPGDQLKQIIRKGFVRESYISDDDFAPAQVWEFVKGENQDWVAEEVEKEKKAPAKRAAKASK